MRFLIPLLGVFTVSGCGAGSSPGPTDAPDVRIANADLVVTGDNQTIVVAPNSHLANIVITGNGNRVDVGVSSTVNGTVIFHGSNNAVHVTVDYWRSLPTHQDGGDGNHLYSDATNG